MNIGCFNFGIDGFDFIWIRNLNRMLPHQVRQNIRRKAGTRVQREMKSRAGRAQNLRF